MIGIFRTVAAFPFAVSNDCPSVAFVGRLCRCVDGAVVAVWIVQVVGCCRTGSVGMWCAFVVEWPRWIGGGSCWSLLRLYQADSCADVVVSVGGFHSAHVFSVCGGDVTGMAEVDVYFGSFQSVDDVIKLTLKEALGYSA